VKKIELILQNKVYAIAIYFILICVIYSQTKNFDFTLDDDLITSSIDTKINNASDLLDIFKERYNRVEYRPIAVLSFGIEYLVLGELNPSVSHVVNFILFFLVIVSIYILFNFITKFKYKYEVFWIVAIFCVHPLCTEVVANIKSRDGLLSMLFCIWSVYFFFKADRNNFSIKYYFISWLLFIIGSFAKLDVFGMVLFVLLYNATKFDKKSFVRAIVLFAVFILGITLIRTTLVDYFLPIEESNSTLAVTTFTENPIADLDGFFIKIFAAIQTLWIYFIKIIFPLDLRYYYGFNYYTIDTKLTLLLFAKFIFFISLLVFMLLSSKKNRYVFIGLIGFVCFIFYALNYYTEVAGIVADRYVFMSLPWFVFIVFMLINRFQFTKYVVVNIIFFVVLILLLFLSYNRTKVWKDTITLVQNDAPHLEKSFEGMRIAASIYYSEFEKTEDKQYLNLAIDCALKANKVYSNSMLINTQLGQFYFKNNETQKSKDYLLKASKVDTTNSTVFHYLGDIYYSEKKYSESEKYYFNALRLSKENQKRILINNISTVYFDQGLYDKVLQFNHDLIKRDSTEFAPYENLGYYYKSKNDETQAKTYFDLAVKHGMAENEVPQ
jgi:hypothetical protein